MKNKVENKKENTIKKWIISFWRNWGFSILIAFIIATSFKSAIAELNHVPTGSMKPTILEGDRIFVNKLSYDLKIPYTTFHIAKWEDPGRGDIVVFFSPNDGKRLVKRVIGLPEDKIRMKNNQLYINGEPLEYDILRNDKFRDMLPDQYFGRTFFNEKLPEVEHYVMITSPLSSFEEITVPVGHYFMMGDNRDNSSDSRIIGPIDRKQIVGRAKAVVFSFKKKEFFGLRWNRLFSKLN